MLKKAGYAAATAAARAPIRIQPEVLQPLVILEAREPAVWNPEQALTWLQAGDAKDADSPMAKAQLANQLFTIMEGLGHDIPEQAWAALSRIPTTAPAHAPHSAAPALLWRLEEAAIGERVGEVVLLSLVLLESPPDVLALSRILRALRQVGLERDAEAIALDMLHVELP